MMHDNHEEYESLQDGFEEYIEKVYSVPVSGMQRQEIERAFYAGCACTFGLITDRASEMDEDAFRRRLISIERDIALFLTKTLRVSAARNAQMN